MPSPPPPPPAHPVPCCHPHCVCECVCWHYWSKPLMNRARHRQMDMTEWHATTQPPPPPQPAQSKIFAAQGHRMAAAPAAHATALRRAPWGISINLRTFDFIGPQSTRARRSGSSSNWGGGEGLTAIAIGTGIGIGPWPDCSSLSRRCFAPTPRNAKRPTLQIIECPCALIAQPVGRARCLTAASLCWLPLSLL